MPDSNITKRALAQTMKDLMAERPFAKISVGDICERCGMNRKSFYYHFRDKHDLVNWIFQTEFIETLHLTDYANAWVFLGAICAYFYQERDFYRSALLIEGQNSFRDYFIETVSPFLKAFTEDIFQGVEDPAFYITFFEDAFMAAILRWLTGSQPMSAEVFSQQLRDVLVNVARKTLSELGEDAPAPCRP